MEKKYKALRTIGGIYKFLGTIAGIITLLTVIGICAASVLGGAALDNFSRGLDSYGYSAPYGVFSSMVGGLIVSLFVIINGGFIALTLFALGEGIYLLISLEENTHATVALLSHKTNS